MKRSIFGAVAALALLASLMGLALASPPDTAFRLAPRDSSVPDDSVASTVSEANEDSATSTSMHDDDSTSTTIDDDGTTPTTIDDSGTAGDQVLSHEIPGVGSVTVEVRGGRLELISVSAPGWSVAVEAESAEIKVKFRSGSSEAEFEAELEDGRVKIETEKHSS